MQRAVAEAAKLDAQQRARAEVAEFEARISALRSVHAEDPTPIDWSKLARSKPPSAPEPVTAARSAAEAQLAAYQPGFFAKLFGTAKTARAKLEDAVRLAAQMDYARNAQIQANYEQQLAAWQRVHHLAGRISSGDTAAYPEALEWVSAFDELEELGSAIEIQQVQQTHVEVDVYINTDEVIPTETKSLTSKSTVSTKKMTATQRNELYQDYVCGSALRVAREVFAALPVATVLVHAVGDLLNTSTGQMESQAVLSVVFAADTMRKLNFYALDASDSMRNFTHHMKFNRSKGFSAVEPLVFAEGVVRSSSIAR